MRCCPSAVVHVAEPETASDRAGERTLAGLRSRGSLSRSRARDGSRQVALQSSRGPDCLSADLHNGFRQFLRP
eukprot:5192385-Alexandrium_andersonii.AAC.1